jgi:hypothetical protein
MQTIVFHLAHDGTPPENASHYATVPWVEARGRRRRWSTSSFALCS